MRKIFIIARHEFLATVTRKAYIFAVIGMPIFFGAVMAIPALIEYFGEDSAPESNTIAIIDRARVIDLDRDSWLGARGSTSHESRVTNHESRITNHESRSWFRSYRDVNQALEDLKESRVAACYVIESDYLTTGNITVYTRDEGLFSDLKDPGREQLYELLRVSLLKDRVDDRAIERILKPASLQKRKVSERGDVKQPESELEKVVNVIAPFVMFFVLTMAIFFSGGYLLQATVEDKQNRVIEILFSSVTPTQLLAGKILGLGAAGLLQVAFYLVVLSVPAATLVTRFEVSVGKLALSLIYFALGYLLFASLLAATGILGNTVQEGNQLSAIWTITSVIPIMLLGPISEAPNSMLARGLSYFPLTAPVTMLLRISIANAPPLDVLISIASLLLGIYLAVRGAAKLFRVAALMYGKRPSLPEILRWLREA